MPPNHATRRIAHINRDMNGMLCSSLSSSSPAPGYGDRRVNRTMLPVPAVSDIGCQRMGCGRLVQRSSARSEHDRAEKRWLRPNLALPGWRCSVPVVTRRRPRQRRISLTRRCSKNRRHDFLDAAPDLRRRAFLYHDGAGHARADQDAGWHVRDVDPDRNALRQSHPGE
jgi:hypothetical protein